MGWTQSERRAAGSLTSTVERRLAVHVEHDVVTESMWEKELKSRQVGYNGEITSVSLPCFNLGTSFTLIAA
jgi:hypothetical protein